jgi:exopolysaccharide production protein ExoQ
VPPVVASLVFVAIILGLFALNRDRDSETSFGLWIPVIWAWIVASRNVSLWLELGPTVDKPDQYLEGSPVDRAVFTILLIAGLIVLAARGRRVISVLRANGPIVIFFLYCGFSVLWSEYPEVSFKRWAKAIGDLVMVLIVLTDSEPELAFKRLLTRASFILIPVSVLFIKYYPALGRSYNQWTYLPSYGGVTTNKNTLGMICMLFGLGSVWRLQGAYRAKDQTRRMPQLIAHGIILGMIFWLFWMADSATSLSCFVLASGLILATGLRAIERRPGLMNLLVFAMIIVPIFSLFVSAGGGLLQTIGRDSSLTGRSDIWKLALSMAGNPVYGTGFEGFWMGKRLEAMWRVDRNISQAHNGYIEIYLNLGLIGLILLGAIIVKGYRNVFYGFRQHPYNYNVRLAFFATALVYNLTEAMFRMLSPVWIFFLLAAMIVPGDDLPRVPGTKEVESSAPVSKFVSRHSFARPLRGKV